MIPMLRVLNNENLRGIHIPTSQQHGAPQETTDDNNILITYTSAERRNVTLPFEVCKRFVRFGHTVRVFLLFHRTAFAVGGSQ